MHGSRSHQVDYLLLAAALQRRNLERYGLQLESIETALQRVGDRRPDAGRGDHRNANIAAVDIVYTHGSTLEIQLAPHRIRLSADAALCRIDSRKKRHLHEQRRHDTILNQLHTVRVLTD